MRRRWLPMVLALLLMPPHAVAGTPDDPEIVAAHGDAPPPYDLQAAWFETERQGVRFTLRIQEASVPQRDTFYYVLFTLEGRRWLAGVGYDADGRQLTYLGPPNPGTGGQGLESFANDVLVKPRQIAGHPSQVTALVPFDAIEGLEPGARLESLGAGVDRVFRGRSWVTEDSEHTQSVYRVEERPSLSLPVGALWGIAGAGAFLAGSVLVGAWWRGRAPQEADSPAASPPPPRPRPQKPARPSGRHRIRLDPRDAL